MCFIKKLLLLYFIVIVHLGNYAQSDSLVSDSKNYQNRKITLTAVAAGGGLALTTGLYFAWYKNYATTPFHFFNDSREWLQMDKAGHTFSNYQLSQLGFKAFKWANFTTNKSILYSSVVSLGYFTIVETMDGFSDGWGFSMSDAGANILGVSVFALQQFYFKEQIIRLKFSFHPSEFASYRPELLGKNKFEQLLKDYNGQTYWISINPAFFINKNFKIPAWLNLAVGYGAEGMISGDDNYVIINSKSGVIGNNRYRKFYLSLDVDLCKIKTKNKLLKQLFNIVNCIKIPAPTIQFGNKKTHFYAFYF